MKTRTILFLIVLQIIMAMGAFATTLKPNFSDKDTIIVTFGKKGKMVIYVDNKEDFKILKSYDLNALLSKINLYLDSTLIEEDYMNDTTFTFNTPVTVNGKSGDREVVVKVETLDDKIEENLEKAADHLEKAAEGVEKITVRLGSLHIDVNPQDTAEEKVKVYRKYEETKRIRYYFNFHLGLNNYSENGHVPINENTLYTLDPLRSRYFAIDFLQKVKIAGNLYFTSGLELAFNNFMFREDVTISKSNGHLIFSEIERDTRKSKLSTTYLNLPVMPMLDFKGNFKIGIGGYVGYRLGSHSKIKYTSGDNVKDHNRSDFYLNNWRYGLRGMIGVRSVKLFLNYDLNPLFKSNHAPKLNAFSFGIII